MAMISLDKLLWEVYAPGTKMEDFLMAPNQHLPERHYECKDCGRTFGTAQEFSDHFERLPDSVIIIGCLATPRAATVQARELPA